MKRVFKSQISDFAFVFLLMCGPLACAADPAPSTDDQLRNSLDSKAGDDYDRALLGDQAKPEAKPPAEDSLQKKLKRELGAASQKEDKAKDPILQIAEEMRQVVPRLDKRDSGKVTQYLQGQIVADLDKLIEQAKKSGSCNCSKPGACKSPAAGQKKTANPSERAPSPAKSSVPLLRKAKNAAPSQQARERMKELFQADLQEHGRDRVLEEPSEYFLPEYELEIQDYFRRLSEDQPEQAKP
jgi:hypothetical protein